MNQEEKKFRKPTRLEQKVIDKTVRSYKNGQKLLLLLLGIMLITISYLVIYPILYGEFSFLHFLLFLLWMTVFMMVLSCWQSIKSMGVAKSCLVFKETNEWYLVPPTTAKGTAKIMVDDKRFFFPFNRFYKDPTTQKEQITFEYVKVFEFPPLTMGQYMFLSINERFITKKDVK